VPKKLYSWLSLSNVQVAAHYIEIDFIGVLFGLFDNADK
jgi:hypothetical protein